MKWKRIFVHGDAHGQFPDLKDFCHRAQTTTEDLLIYLGDVALNYNLDEHDEQRKKFLAKMPITFLMIRGNHEARPEDILTIKKVYNEDFKCEVYTEPKYPNIFYINCDEFYLNEYRCLAVSGAYSVDKEYRLMQGWRWFFNEQPTEEEKEYVRQLVCENPKFDFVFTHTCPLRYEPTHLFLNSIDQTKVDKNTEIFLDEIYDLVDKDTLQLWMCGHYHADEWLGPGVRMFFNEYKMIGGNEENVSFN